jgi:hypothetical protein
VCGFFEPPDAYDAVSEQRTLILDGRNFPGLRASSASETTRMVEMTTFSIATEASPVRCCSNGVSLGRKRVIGTLKEA